MHQSVRVAIALFWVSLALPSLSGCASSTGEPEPEPVEGEDPEGCEEECIEGFEEKTCSSSCMAPFQCRVFVDVVCEGLSDVCDGLTFNECKNELSQAFPCDDTVAVSETYDECLLDLERLEVCGEPFPLACQQILLRADGSAETCQEMADRWQCLFDDAVPTCTNAEGEALSYPICVCQQGFILTAERECTETCANKALDLSCPLNAEPFCGQQFGTPTCICSDGYVDESGDCVESCALILEGAFDNCDNFYPNSHLECEDPLAPADPLCFCDPNYIGLTLDTGFACIEDICVEKVIHWRCVRSNGTTDPNCTCTCDDADQPSDDPSCLCNQGYSYNQGQGQCVAN